jgi:hypothetical protein
MTNEFVYAFRANEGTHTKFLRDRTKQIFQDQKTEMQIYCEFTANQRSCATRDQVKLRISFD